MLVDTFGRKIDYLRISVTKECNFRCQYCMPNTPMSKYQEKNLISLDDIFNFVKIAIDNGVVKIRITGGEPLLRSNLDHFIMKIKKYKNDIDICLTTNGFLLHKHVYSLYNAGLKRINVSLDSLQPHIIKLISKIDGLKYILNGLEKAKKLDFKIKINMVVLKNINEDEIFEMMNFCYQNGFFLRFIEYMQNTNANSQLIGLKSQKIIQKLIKFGDVNEVKKDINGPSTIYKFKNKNLECEFGIINPHDDEFCKNCNRIRLTSEGIICPCLYHQDSIDIKEKLKTKDLKGLETGLFNAVYNKPEKNFWGDGKISTRAFYETGG